MTPDFSKPIPIGIPLRSQGPNPSAYYASQPIEKAIRMGNFIGALKEGGSVNYTHWQITPHGNGTHTECLGHIFEGEDYTVAQCFPAPVLVLTQVLTIQPERQTSSFNPEVEDWVIPMELIKKHLRTDFEIQAICIRTSPNLDEKLNKNYSGTNPPYYENGVGALLAKHNILHWLTDTPSLDREEDAGLLNNHKGFWDPLSNGLLRKNASVTEMIYIPDHAGDGLYFLLLHPNPWYSDAAPSYPVLYPIAYGS